eukprot:CAMPEP_0171688774 /NCGR_PEP_ID=MMETSP0991-20121206/4089_1 /TAXON_ID=483369 /ORGANISM="non described non described, Strain CCMP2098" /LENGTH=189 /DNA_ID=CAMNT_0012276767 /DNA_START=375 /DNA_END=941 /DNA_ORIENTATION=-
MRAIRAAGDCTLTRGQYVDLRTETTIKSLYWKSMVRTTALVATYATLALIAVLDNPGMDPYVSRFEEDYVREDFFHVVALGKETLLLFVLVGLVTSVNDHADAVTSALSEATWGAPGSPGEGVRNDLLHLSTNSSIALGALSASWYDYVATPKLRPISYTILGIRPTKGFMLALLSSFAVSAVVSVVRS